jgi:hypothetical protein
LQSYRIRGIHSNKTESARILCTPVRTAHFNLVFKLKGDLTPELLIFEGNNLPEVYRGAAFMLIVLAQLIFGKIKNKK